MLNLTELGVEVFIKKSQAASLSSFWDNYDLPDECKKSDEELLKFAIKMCK